MVKLSEQLAKKRVERLTRTERVKEKQTHQRFLLEQSREKAKFEAKKKIAEELQEKDFADIKDVKEYEEKYQTLDPELKPFFSTPASVQQAQTERIEETKSQVTDRFTHADQQIQKARELLARKEASYQRDRKWLQDQNYDSEKYREKRDRLNRDYQEDEDDFEETERYWQGYKKGLTESLQKLNQGEDLSYSSIHTYSSSIGDYEERKKRARNEQAEFDKSQLQKITRLQAQGYKPFVIEKSYKGKTEEAYLTFKKDGDWQRVAKFKAPKQISTSGLEKSKLGRVEVERSLFVSGKEFKFKSNLQLYKDPQGKLSTKYGSIQQNENVIIKQAQDTAYKDWQTTQKEKPLEMPFKELKEGEELPFGYGGQQTISDQPTTQLITTEQYYAQKDKPFVPTKITAPIKKVWEKIPTGKWYYTPQKIFGLNIGTGISPIKTDESAIDITAKIEKGSEKLGSVSGEIKEWALADKGKEKVEELDLELETKYQEKYQTAFERKHMEDLIYEKTTFEEATKSFEESKEAKLLQREYQEEYQTKYDEISSDIPILRASVGGLGIAGINLAQLGLRAVKTPKSAIVSGALVYTGLKTLSAIPPTVSYTTSGTLGIYGTYKVVSPTSTIEERGAGLLMAGVSFGTLGYGAYKHLRSPVIKTVKIKSPKATLKASETIGKDVKLITKQGVQKMVTFPQQKLSQIGVAGRRTIVTTKGRLFSQRFWKAMGVKPRLTENYIYKGIPTQQLGKIKTIKSLTGTYTYKTPSGYQKALKKLTKYGYTTAQARATLRYSAPRVYEQYLKRGVLTLKGDTAKGEFQYLTKQEVFVVDKRLGIKTRAAPTIKETYLVRRKLGIIKEQEVVREAQVRTSVLLDKSGRIKDFKALDFSRGIIIGKPTDVKKGFEYVSKDVYGTKIFKSAEYRDLYGVSIKARTFPSDKIISVDASKTKLITKIVDLSKSKYVKPTGLKKTPFAKTFGKVDTKDIVVEVIGKSKPSTTQKIVDKIDDLSSKASGTTSKYYGTGQYERAVGGVTPQEIGGVDLQQTLRAAPTPEKIKVFELKDLIRVKQLDLSTTGLNVGTVLAIKSVTDLKLDSKLDSSLKVDTKLKDLIKTDQILKTKQIPALKQAPTLKSVLKSKLDLRTPTISLKTPSITTPRTPSITPPPIKPAAILWPILRKQVTDKLSKKKKKEQEFAFLPDFTSRALGLDPEIITGKQARARVKKVLTGLEIRRPVRIK